MELVGQAKPNAAGLLPKHLYIYYTYILYIYNNIKQVEVLIMSY